MQISTEKLDTITMSKAVNAIPGGISLLGNMQYLCDNGVGYAIYNDGVAVCMGGVFVMPYPRGVGTAWLIANPQAIKSIPKFVIAFGRSVLTAAWLKLALHRIEADVESSQRQNCKFAMACGFAPESVMKRYSSEGHDVTRFAIV